MEKDLNREIYENAINTMKKYGIDSILSQKILPKKDKIKISLLEYYEKTEEFEKCMFVKNFFEALEEKIRSERLDYTGVTGESTSNIC